jgi:hypothetical protein
MTSVRALALAATLMTASAVAASAQAPWPNSQPQGQSAWPSSQPQPQPQQAPWPNSAAAPAPAPQPQQAPWPNSAPPAQPMAAAPMGGGGGFGGPPMGGGGGFGGPPMGGPPQECMTQFTALRGEVEKRGMAAKTASEKHATREEMCKLVTEYGAAENKWIKYTEANASKCGIPKEIVAQLKASHARTATGQKQLCAAGPAVAATPTLSDALGTATLPTREPEKKRKPGGTMDTLTGNALGQ